MSLYAAGEVSYTQLGLIIHEDLDAHLNECGCNCGDALKKASLSFLSYTHVTREPMLTFHLQQHRAEVRVDLTQTYCIGKHGKFGRP